jgi:thimet oligopeptidase
MLKKISLLISISSLLGSCAHQSAQYRKLANENINLESSALIRYDYKEGELLSLCQNVMTSLKSELQQWQLNFQNHQENVEALLKFEEINANTGDALSPLTFMASVSKDNGIRDESAKCAELSSIDLNAIYTNREYYNILKKLKTTDASELRLLKDTLLGFEMNGMKLNEFDLAKYKILIDRLSQLSIQFSQNLNNDISTVLFTESELEGAKPDFIANLKKDDTGRFIVTTKYPDYNHVMTYVRSSEVRKKMSFTFNNRQEKINTPILQEAIKIRSEVGKLMGYDTYADYSLTEKMAGHSKVVFDFLNGLKDKLSAKNKSDIKTLSEFKSLVLKDSSPLQPWDIGFITNLLEIQKYNIDQEILREYFPAQHVVAQTFDIYSHLLGVDFYQIKNAPVWSPQVQLYEVIDHESKKIIGHFYADLFPREGKYGHAAAFSVISGRALVNDKDDYQKPISAIVANFTPPTADKPSLLSHDEVETFFHEFGHIMHQVLTKAKFAGLSGTRVKRDFVEAPSQMLENWVWQKEILVKMSQHYLDSKKSLPEDMIERLQKTRMLNSGIQYTRQLVYGIFDMNIHTNPNLNVTQEFSKVYFELTGLNVLKGTHFPATFNHIMGGYTAGYYGYLWSKVFAEDMFSVFLQEGILNEKTGMRYRKEILEKGNMFDPLVLVNAFLKRESNNLAFLESLGL